MKTPMPPKKNAAVAIGCGVQEFLPTTSAWCENLNFVRLLRRENFAEFFFSKKSREIFLN
jgi:hypothetical protein